MKAFSLLIVFGAFLAGAFVSVLDPREVNWPWLVLALLIGGIGLWLSRKVHKEEAHAGHKLSGNIDLLSKSLDNILARLELINKNKEELPTYEARFEIDRLFREELNTFADARESMIHVFGMQNYADVMSGVMGERYVKTPNLDALAKRGMRFDRAYASNPICVPARNSIFSGHYPFETGLQSNAKKSLPAKCRRPS